jgi:hypothetical protein
LCSPESCTRIGVAQLGIISKRIWGAVDSDIEIQQRSLCDRYGASYYPSPPDAIVGIASNARENVAPINGLRHLPEGNTTGWYIWAGEELSEDPEFFEPLHVRHLVEWYPLILKYLGLPSGWRFLVAGDYEDVWYDESLLA